MAFNTVREEEAEDDYWSKPSRKAAGSNFFDDDSEDQRGIFGVDKKQAKSLKETLQEAGLGIEDDDDVDTIDWQGNITNDPYSKSSSTKFSSQSQSTTLMTTSSGVQSARGTGGSVKISGASSISFTKETNNLNSNVSTHIRSASFALGEKRPTSSSLSTPEKSNSASSTSLAEAIRRDGKQPTITDIAKLQAEVQSLNRKLKIAERSRWVALPVADTVTRIILGENYSLEPYRSLQDKLSLLDAAIGNHDGNAILVVVLFMRKTLSKTVFYEQISKRPEAANQYIAYIKSHHDKRETVASEMGHLCRIEEAAMWRYGTANLSSIPHARLKNLMDCQGIWFERNHSLSEESASIKEQITLLNKQLLIETTDDKNEREGRSPFKEMPRKANLYFKPLTTTLFYCCIYHYGEHGDYPSSPLHIKREFKLGEKHYLLVAISARSKVKKWDDLEPLFTSKNWLGKSKMKPVIKFEQVVNILVINKAPYNVLDKFLRFVEDEETRLEMAAKHKQHEVVIDTLFQMKDKQRLIAYQSKVPHRTESSRRIEDLFRNSVMIVRNRGIGDTQGSGTAVFVGPTEGNPIA